MAKKKNVPVNNNMFDQHQERTFKDGLINNGLENVIMGQALQTAGGKQVTSVETLAANTRGYLISNMRQILSQAYAEQGIIQTVVDVPVDDAMRGGVEIKSSQLSPDEHEQLAMMMEEKNDIGTYGQGLKWNRLFGGGGIVIITGQDPEDELDMDSLEGEKVEFRAVDMWELFQAKQNTEDYGSDMNGDVNSEYFDYYGKKLHKSRVVVFKGITAPAFIRPRLRGWGLSIVETLVRAFNQYLKSTDLMFEVLDEFKLDIFKIDGLATTLALKNGESMITKRVELANFQKNFQNAMSMDANDDYVQKQLSFSGLAEVMSGIRMQIASELRMPITKIFGVSAAGFSSGEDDIENYNSMVESQIRQKYKFGLVKLIKIRCVQLFGYVPDDLTITFKSLRVLPADMQENVKTQKFSRLLQAQQAGLISPQEFKQACNKEELLIIQVDENTGTLKTGDNTEEEGKAKAATPPAKKSSLAAKPAPAAKE